MDARSIEVLQRHSGYLCLRFPPPLNSVEFGGTLDAALQKLPGIQQVAWVAAEGKLLVRFDPEQCTHADVARLVKAQLPENTPATEPAEEAQPAPLRLAERLAGLRAQLIAASPERMRPLVEGATTEKAVTNFVNDIVAFYLIRTHWNLISRLWLKNPVKYGNAWLTVFYLVFLMVRYRKS
jgi:hypothetical protein